MKRRSLANFIKAGSLRAGFYIACCTLLTNAYADQRLRIGIARTVAPAKVHSGEEQADEFAAP